MYILISCEHTYFLWFKFSGNITETVRFDQIFCWIQAKSLACCWMGTRPLNWTMVTFFGDQPLVAEVRHVKNGGTSISLFCRLDVNIQSTFKIGFCMILLLYLLGVATIQLNAALLGYHFSFFGALTLSENSVTMLWSWDLSWWFADSGMSYFEMNPSKDNAIRCYRYVSKWGIPQDLGL